MEQTQQRPIFSVRAASFFPISTTSKTLARDILYEAPIFLVEFFFFVGFDGAVRGWISDTGQDISSFHLVII